MASPEKQQKQVEKYHRMVAQQNATITAYNGKVAERVSAHLQEGETVVEAIGVV